MQNPSLFVGKLSAFLLGFIFTVGQGVLADSWKTTPTMQDDIIMDAEYFASIDTEALNSLLKPRGWRVASDTTGGKLLFPGAAEVSHETQPPQNVAALDVSTPAETTETGFDSAAKNSSLASLDPQGWRVESDGAGGLLLFPRASEMSHESQSSVDMAALEVTEPNETTEAARSVVEVLQATLSPHGWRVEQDGDGGLLLFPQSA